MEISGGVPTPGDVTRWLRQLDSGDSAAMEQLVPLLYAELRTIARSRLRGERAHHTLDTTALVHEAYLRLHHQKRLNAGDRTAFLAIAGNTMRRVLIDYARTKKRLKRGAGATPLPLEEVEHFLSESEAEEILELDDALDRLEEMNPEGARVVQHRFFAGLTLDETAQVLGVSTKTVQRRWLAARAWLRKEIATDAVSP